MADSDEAVYSIGAVARMLDIPTSTLRAWEERYELISPARSGGAQRLYSAAQVEQLRFVKAQIEGGASAADAHRLLATATRGRIKPPTAPASSGRRPLVLIAERDAFAADLSVDYLRGQGFDVDVALDAVQARLTFHERTPEVALVDLLIGGGAGYRLVEEMGASGASVVIAMSAIDSSEDAAALGAAAFVRKPVDLPRLAAKIHDLLAAPLPARAGRRQTAAP